MRRYLGVAVLVAAAACGAKKTDAPAIRTATVSRRDIIVDAQANGSIEPINIVQVKSKASGMITKMPVETGTNVKPGDLLVQVDTRDVQNKFDQAMATLQADSAKLKVALSEKQRNDKMFKAHVITAQENEQSQLDLENARAAVVSAQANLDLAKQSLEDATVRAPVAGTIIEKDASQGVVITSATGSFGGGTLLLQMADLSEVRIRALFNETDIGSIRPGEPAIVTVDAYPDRRFQGVVEKIEPQAVIQQNVTMFPVLVNLDNKEGLLRPGMNGETSVLIDERDNVLAVPNDAVKSPREAVAVASMLGLNPDSVQAQLKAQGGAFGGFGGRGGRGGRGGQGGQGGANRGGAAGASSGGEVALGESPAQQGQGYGQGGQGFQMPQVSDADCKQVDAAFAKHPKEKKELDSLRAAMMSMRGQGGGFGGRGGQGGGFSRGAQRDSGAQRGGFTRGGGQGGSSAQGGGFRGSPEMQAISEKMRAIYATVGVDARTAGACLRREQGGANGASSGYGRSQFAGSGSSQSQGGRTGALQPSPEMGAVTVRPHAGLVFVVSGTTYQPRIVQLGQANFDYTEVLSGLKEGDKVVLLTALTMQAQRDQQNDRFRQATGGGLPGVGGRGR